jgi:hypothetical protein
MTARPPHRWRMSGRRGKAAAVLLLVTVAGATVGVALTVTTASSGAARAVSYCSASRTVDNYHGHDAARLVSLLEDVRRHAPVEIASTVALMRAARPSSAAFRAARTAWDRYNTNHCCTCIGGPGVPQLASTAPPNRSP